MKDIGLTSDINAMPAKTVSQFLQIHAELDDLREKERKRKKR
jgi:hypothetical protein